MIIVFSIVKYLLFTKESRKHVPRHVRANIFYCSIAISKSNTRHHFILLHIFYLIRMSQLSKNLFSTFSQYTDIQYHTGQIYNL